MKSPILSKLKTVRLNKLIEYEESYTRQTKESQTLGALNIYRVWVIVFIEKPSLNQLIEYWDVSRNCMINIWECTMYST